MRIVFCGSGQVATVTLGALCAAGHELPLVITQPPRRAGRGGKLAPTPVAQCAESLGLTVRPCANINEPPCPDTLAQMAPELIVVVDFGQKIGEEIRHLAPHGAINMHASLLPALRGAAPINWALIRGLTRTGVTTFRLIDAMDAGPILLQEVAEIDARETAEDLRARLAALGAEVVNRTIVGLAAGTLTDQGQDPQKVTLAPKLAKRDGAIDFADGAADIVNRIRGTWPWPGAHADFIGAGREPVRVIFVEARAMPSDEPSGAEAGTITDDLTVNVPDGVVEILQLKVAGKRIMGWRDFINGYRVAAGDRFACPQEGDRG